MQRNWGYVSERLTFAGFGSTRTSAWTRGTQASPTPPEVEELTLQLAQRSVNIRIQIGGDRSRPLPTSAGPEPAHRSQASASSSGIPSTRAEYPLPSWFARLPRDEDLRILDRSTPQELESLDLGHLNRLAVGLGSGGWWLDWPSSLRPCLSCRGGSSLETGWHLLLYQRFSDH